MAHLNLGFAAVMALSLIVISSGASAVEWRCVYGDDAGWTVNFDTGEYYPAFSIDEPEPGKRCEDLLQNASPNDIQIVVFPTGFDASQKSDYFKDLNNVLGEISLLDPDNQNPVFTAAYAERFLYIVVWQESLPVPTEQDLNNGQQSTVFGAYVADDGASSKDRLLLDEDLLFTKIEQVKNDYPGLDPDNAVVVFNKAGRANATLPNRKPDQKMGVTRISGGFPVSGKVLKHELGHSYMAWQDEYLERNFNHIDITSLDPLTFLGVWHPDGEDPVDAFETFLNIYDINLSEIYVAGSDNVSTAKCPARVGSFVDCMNSFNDSVLEQSDYAPAYDIADYSFERYEYEGSAIFLGVYKEVDGSLMKSNSDFHSSSQARVVKTAFTGDPARPNDRIRNAGPLGYVDVTTDRPDLHIPGVDEEFFSVMLMGYDEDKFHHWQPTLEYEVQVSYQAPYTGTCYFALIFPYSCTKYRNATLRKDFSPDQLKLLYEGSVLDSLSELVNAFVELLGGTPLDFEGLAKGVLIPYQMFEVELPKSGKDFYWQFRTRNGPKQSNGACSNYCSAWTGKTRFYQFD